MKARSAPLVRRRVVELYQGSDARWRELFQSADIMSEGAIRPEKEGPRYYGTTSLLLPRRLLGATRNDEMQRLARIMESDPHARTRAVRIAHREAQVRAPGLLGQMTADLVMSADASGIWIRIDVDASVATFEAAPTLHRGRGSAERRQR